MASRPPFADTELAIVIALARALGLRDAANWPLPQSVNWVAFLDLASNHGLLPWLGLGLGAETGVPETVRDACAAERLKAAQRNIMLAAELGRVVRAHESAGIDVIAFKGPVAAAQLHADLSRRPSGDIDLLVHERDWDRSASILERLGYSNTAIHDDSLQGSFYQPESTAKVDLHWGVPPVVLRFNERALWRARAMIDLIGESIPTFEIHDATAIAAINLLKEHWKPKLHAVVDIAAGLARLDDAQWRRLRRRSRQLRCERVLLAAGNVCWRLFGDSFPRELVADCTANPAAQVFGTEILARLFSEEDETKLYTTRRDPSVLADNPVRLRLHRIKIAFTPTEYDADFLPLSRAFPVLQYLVRPVRLLWKRLNR